MNPCSWGWEIRENVLQPVWFEGSSLPTDAEYELHIKGTSIYHTEEADLSVKMTLMNFLNQKCTHLQMKMNPYVVMKTFDYVDILL